MKPLISTLLLTGCILYTSIQAPLVHHKILFRMAKRATVRVGSVLTDGEGSGFFARGKSGNKYLVTAKHVCVFVAEAGILAVKSNKTGSLENVAVQASLDSGDVCIANPTAEGIPLKLGSNPSLGDTVYFTSRPGGLPMTFSTAIVMAYGSKEYTVPVKSKEQCSALNGAFSETIPQLFLFQSKPDPESTGDCTIQEPSFLASAPAYGGMSGGPVLDTAGRVVGLFTGNTDFTTYTAVITPVSKIKQLLSRY